LSPSESQERLDRLRESADASARNFRTVFVSYLVIALYILVIISSTDHELLFRAGDVQAPIINVGVPVVWFFTFVPWILLFLHFNLLLQGMFLSRKVHAYRALLPDISDKARAAKAKAGTTETNWKATAWAAKIAEATKSEAARTEVGAAKSEWELAVKEAAQAEKATQDKWAGTDWKAKTREEQIDLLFPAPLAHMVGGGDSRRGTRVLLSAMVIISVAILPLAILIYAEIQFLPYQDEARTWMHRALVMVDFALLWWLWPRLSTPGQGWREWWGRTQRDADGDRLNRISPLRHLRNTVNSIVTFSAVFFIIFIAEFPGGAVDELWPLEKMRDGLDRKYALSERVLILEEPAPETLAAYVSGCGRGKPKNGEPENANSDKGLCNTRALDKGSILWCKHAKPLHLNGRSLQHADLRGSTLCAAELEFSDLSHANLNGIRLGSAKLHGAVMREAQLSGAVLSSANLAGADLTDATMRGAHLSFANFVPGEMKDGTIQSARLNGADLTVAELHSADLDKAKLNRANLLFAKLHGTNLPEAELQGALLSFAELYGTDLRAANLNGAWLFGAELYGAYLREAKLNGAGLLGAKLNGANLWEAKLNGANLQQAELHGADIREAELHGANLKGARMVGIQLHNANLTLSDLRDINLTDAPDWEALREKVSDKISDPAVTAEVLERLADAEQRKTIFSLLLINNSIFGRNNELARSLGLLTQNPMQFSPDREAEYLELLYPYLANDVACGDDEGYIVRRYASPFFYSLDRKKSAGLALALTRAPCTETIEKGLAMLTETSRDDFYEAIARQEAVEETQ